MHLPRSLALLTGDIAISEPGGGVTLGPFNVDRIRAGRALRRLAALGARVGGLGHGRPLLQDAHETLRHAGDSFGAAARPDHG